MVATMLKNIQIVMVNTTHPGNIGAAARAMKNMCLQSLRLVAPSQFPHASATARASGADDILANAQVYEDLDQALSDCTVVVGASARLRRLTWPQLNPAETADLLLKHGQETKVAVLFGREHAGLTNEELERCHYLMHIPSNPEYSSLNVAAAIQVLSYEIFSRTQGQQQTYDKQQEPLADAGQMEGFYDHLFQVLTGIGFLHQEHPRKMMRRLRRLFNRSQPDRVEMNILRGILSTIEKKMK